MANSYIEKHSALWATLLSKKHIVGKDVEKEAAFITVLRLTQPLQKTQVGVLNSIKYRTLIDLQIKCVKGIRSHGLLMPNTFSQESAHGIRLSVHQ